MEVLTFLFTSLIGFLGIVIGFAVAFIAPEELNPGKKHVRALHLMSLLAFLAALDIAWRKGEFVYHIMFTKVFYLYLLLALCFVVAFFRKPQLRIFGILLAVLAPLVLYATQDPWALGTLMLFLMLEAITSLHADKKHRIMNSVQAAYPYLAYFATAFALSLMPSLFW